MEYLEAKSPYGEMVLSYGAGFTQDIADQTARLDKRDVQLLEVKEMNDLVAEYRAQLRAMMNEYRAMQNDVTAGAKQHYVCFESVLLRRRIADIWIIYRLVVADSREMMTAYIANLQQGGMYKFYKTSPHTEKTVGAIA